MQSGGAKGKWTRRKCVLDAGNLKCFDEKEGTSASSSSAPSTPRETLPLKELVLIADCGGSSAGPASSSHE